MQQWYECRVRYDKNIDGKMKKVTEAYLVDAVNYTEAETRIIEEECQYLGSEYQITNIKRPKIAEVFPSEADCDDKWYNVKIKIILIDEEKGIEKKVSQVNLVQASSVEMAIKYFNEAMKGTVSDYEIAAVAESAIVDYLPYKVNEKISADIEKNSAQPVVPVEE